MPTYKIIGRRFLRKYTAPEATPVYAAATDAARIVRELCNVPWEASAVRQAEMPPHGDEDNPQNRERFDAALFCAGHADNMHRAYANAAVYRYALPSAAVGKTLTGLAVRVTSDPYNAAGARVHVFANATGEIPTSCRAVRGDGDDGQPLEDGTAAAGVAPRETKTVKGQDYWYPVTAEASLAPTGGLVLQKYLFVAVVLESYATTRGNWLEGASHADNLVTATLSEAVDGWTDGGTHDLSGEDGREFVVVSGGVMAAPPSGACAVRALSLQRTGDAFVRRAAEAVQERPRVCGIRLLDVSSPSAATFLEPLSGAEASGVVAVPALTDYFGWFNVTFGASTVTQNVDQALSHGVVGGDFQDGTFTDLPGLLIVARAGGRTSVVRSERPLGSLLKFNNAALRRQTAAFGAEDGGFPGSWLSYAPSAADGATAANFKWDRILALRLGTRSYQLDGVNLLVALDEAGTSVVGAMFRSTGTAPAAWKARGADAAALVPYVSDPVASSERRVVCTYAAAVLHDATARTVSCGGVSVSYVGTVTAVRPLNGAASSATATLVVVSGRLASVGGVPCANCAVVTFGASEASVAAPECDAALTPDTYRGFAVSCPCGSAPDASTFYATGAFTSLGGVPARGAAVWSRGRLRPLGLPEGTRWPEYFLATDAFGGRAAVWVDAADDGGGEGAPGVWEAPAAAATDAQSAFGLRRLYAALYAGEVPSVPVPASDARPGAAFVVRGDEVSVPTAGGKVAARRWGLAAAPLAVPFSCPRDFAASRIRLSWGAVAATPGSRVNVWLARGRYAESAPESLPKALFTGEAARVGEWELAGTVLPEDGAAGSATLDVAPIENDVATLLFVAFAGQDDLNPSSGMALPRGVGALDVDPFTGEATGLSSGFLPDVTLLE